MSDPNNNQFNPGDIQEPTYPQYTNLALNQGLFDQLMATCKHHIQEEYDEHRIQGAEFSQLYLGMLQAVLQNTTQYLLGTKLIDQEVAQAEAQRALTLKQIEEIDGNLRLIDLQEAELRFRIEKLFPLEEQKMQIEIQKLEQERLLIESQVRKSDYEVDFILPANLLQIQATIDKIRAEIDYLDAQEAMMLKQALKIDKEIEFLTAKIATEWANTQGTPGGLIGRQMSLLTAQKLGFAGDIQAKIAKMYADFDSVVVATFEAEEAAGAPANAGGAASAALGTAGSIAGA